MSVNPSIRKIIIEDQTRTSHSASVGQAVTERTGHFHTEIFLAQAGPGRTIDAFEKNSVVFAQGDPADALFYIQRGKLKLSVVSNEGKEAVIAVLNGGDFFGEGCLGTQHHRAATAVAMSECSITRLDKATAIEMIAAEPSFSSLILSYALIRTSRVEEDLIDQLFNSSEKRLARALLTLANFGKEESPEKFIAKISQETLAEMIGTTRSRVSFFMNKFRKLGYISYATEGRSKIEVHSSLLDVVLHD